MAFEHGVNPSTVSSSGSGAGAVGGWPRSSMDDWLAGPPHRLWIQLRTQLPSMGIIKYFPNKICSKWSEMWTTLTSSSLGVRRFQVGFEGGASSIFPQMWVFIEYIKNYALSVIFFAQPCSNTWFSAKFPMLIKTLKRIFSAIWNRLLFERLMACMCITKEQSKYARDGHTYKMPLHKRFYHKY